MTFFPLIFLAICISNGDFLISLSASGHLGGGHASIAFNVSEFFKRILSDEDI